MIRTEAELAAYVSEQVTTRRLFAYHLDAARRRYNPSSRGFPDWVIAGPSGILFRELKGNEGVLTQEQRQWGRILNYAGGNWAVWKPQHARDGSISAELNTLVNGRNTDE
jgi:hypothetical protein